MPTPEEAGELRPDRLMVLRHVADCQTDIRKISETYRQRAIDLAMMEPPLVDIDGDRMFVTTAGRAALLAAERVRGTSPATAENHLGAISTSVRDESQ